MPSASMTASFEVLTAHGQFSTPLIARNTVARLLPAVQSDLTTAGIARGLITRNFGLSSQITLVPQSPAANGGLPKEQYGLAAALQGPPMGIEFPVGALGLANVIAASGSVVSPLLPSLYCPHLVVAVTSSQNGALNVQRYVDKAGTVVQGAVLTAAITGGTGVVIDNADGKGFAAFTITVTNTGGSLANLTAVVCLLLAR